jgi:hypothetical protein
VDRLYPVTGLDEVMQMKLSGSFVVAAMITVPLIPPPRDFSAVFAHSHILKYTPLKGTFQHVGQAGNSKIR